MAIEWKDIEGYNGVYQVSSDGKVRSLDREEVFSGRTRVRKGRILKTKLSKGYEVVHLRGIRESWPSVHRLVALAFIPNPDNKPTVNHKNGIKSDNTVSNLEWSTHSEQTLHAYEYNLIERRGKTLYSLEFKDRVKREYDESVVKPSIKELARTLNISEYTASCIVKGKYGDARKPSKGLVSRVKELRSSGMTLSGISKETGMSISAIARWTSNGN